MNNLIQIIKKHNENFKTISLTCINDKILSWRAKGIHTYLLTRPNNWEVSVSDLEKRSTETPGRLSSGIKELINAKYLYRIVKRDDRQRIIKWGLLVLEEPIPRELVEKFIDSINLNSSHSTETWKIASTREKSTSQESPHVDNSTCGESGKCNNIIRRKLINNVSSKEDTHKSFSDENDRDSGESLSQSSQKKLVKVLTTPSNVKEVFDYWTSKTLHLPREGTKSYNECIRKTKDLLKNYSLNQIKQVIDKFELSAFNSDYAPINKDKKKKLQKLSIGDFIMTFSGYSYFKEYLKKNLDEEELIKDKYPVITENLKRMYLKDVTGGVGEKGFDTKYENCFRRASIKLREFYDKHRHLFNPFMVKAHLLDSELARWLWESIKHSFNNNDDFTKVRPTWLVSQNTFEHRLPAYLHFQHIFLGDVDVDMVASFPSGGKVESLPYHKKPVEIYEW